MAFPPRRLFVACILGSALASMAAAQEVEANRVYTIWGDPKAGRKVYAEKGCGKCHALNGVGPTIGPDLGQTEPLSITRIAGAMWNHAPEMRKAAREKGVRWPTFQGSEFRDLVAFLYYLRMLDRPGNARRGEHLFDEKRCSTCHAFGGRGGTIGPDLTRWRRYASPILWAEIMWRHAVEMEGKMQEMGVAWPRFDDDEMLDLLTFVEREVGAR